MFGKASWRGLRPGWRRSRAVGRAFLRGLSRVPALLTAQRAARNTWTEGSKASEWPRPSNASVLLAAARSSWEPEKTIRAQVILAEEGGLAD